MMPWNSASRPSFTEPRAESPSTMYSSRRATSLVRQSTNFCTRLAMSTEPARLLLLMDRRAFSPASRLRLLMRICRAASSAAWGFSSRKICRCSRRKSVIPSWRKRLFTAFLVWFS